MTDEQIVALFQGVDGEGPSREDEGRAWAAFEAEVGDRIRRTCEYTMRRAGHPEESDDMVQKTRMKLVKDRYRAIRSFRLGEAKMTTWVTRIATNSCNEWLRSRNKPVWTREQKDEDRPKAEQVEPGPDPFELLGAAEGGQRMVAAMAHCIASLDDKRQVAVLTRLLMQLAFEGQRVTVSEIGRVLGASPQLMKYRMDTAVEQLRTCVGKQLATPAAGGDTP